MKIVVLAGGLSTERDVSLSSGAKICTALRETGHRAVLIDMFFGIDDPYDLDSVFDRGTQGHSFSVSRSEPDIAAVRAARRPDGGVGGLGRNVIELCRAADIVFIALHGEDGENGKLQGLLDIYEIKYTGSGALASALAMNKQLGKRTFAQAGVPTPDGKVYHRNDAANIVNEFELPCVIKPCSGGSSVGVSIPQTEEEMADAIVKALKYEDRILVEEYVAGREIQVGVLGDSALPPIEIISNGQFYDYENKYQAGMAREVCPAQIPPEAAEKLQRYALRAYHALGCQVYSRIDFILRPDGRAACLEVNTLPGMTPTSLLPQEAAVEGISYEELCNMIVHLSLQKYK